MHKTSIPLALILAAARCSLIAAQPDLTKLPPPAAQPGVTYARDIRPLFEASCFNCHGERRQRAGLRLDSLEAALQGGDEGKVITPGNSKESSLVIAVAQLDDETAMPPKRGRGGFGGFGGPGGPGGPGGGRGPGGGGPGARGGFGAGNLLAPVMFTQADIDKDKKVTRVEFSALANTWFEKFDSDKTGKLSEDQLADHLEESLPAPNFGGGGGRGRGPGGQRGGNEGMGFSLAGMVVPGLFSTADIDKDKSLTLAELQGTFEKWFVEWDSEKSGSLTEEKFLAGLNSSLPRPGFGGFGGGGRPGGPGGPGGGGGFGGFGFGRGAMAQQILAQGDTDKNNKLSKSEFLALSEAWFAKLDSDKTGKVTQEQLVQKFAELMGMPAVTNAPARPGADTPEGTPEARPRGGARAGGQGRGGPGGSGPGQAMGAGLFTATDADKNGSLTRAEFTTTFAKWFVEWDADKTASLNEDQVANGLRAALPQGGFGGFGGGPGGFGGNAGPAPKPLTAAQVGLIRAWIDQGAK